MRMSATSPPIRTGRLGRLLVQKMGFGTAPDRRDTVIEHP
jgi:hypothetical protein